MALSGITDIPAPECMVILCLIVAFGWLIATRDAKSSLPEREKLGSQDANSSHFGNYSIMDICMLTTVVACLLTAIPKLTVHPLFFLALMVSMAMGVTACWLVVRWVCYDAWTPKMLYWMAVPIILGGATCVLLAPEGQNATSVMSWMISGPIAVITSQATVVMLLLAIHRFETDPGTFRSFVGSPKA